MEFLPRSEGGGETREVNIYVLRLRLESMDGGGVNGGRWVYEGAGGRDSLLVACFKVGITSLHTAGRILSNLLLDCF